MVEKVSLCCVVNRLRWTLATNCSVCWIMVVTSLSILSLCSSAIAGDRRRGSSTSGAFGAGLVSWTLGAGRRGTFVVGTLPAGEGADGGAGIVSGLRAAQPPIVRARSNTRTQEGRRRENVNLVGVITGAPAGG